MYASKLNIHQDILCRCLWPNKTKCTVDDFKPIFTDFGLCYVINSEPKKGGHVTHTGENYGLLILLNSANYERITGPSSTNGMKVVRSDHFIIYLIP